MADPSPSSFVGSTWTPRVDESDNVQFGHINVGAGLIDHQINWGGCAATEGLAEFVAPHAGYIPWVSACLSENAVGSSLIVDVFKNDVDISEACVIADGERAAYATFAIGALPFVAGDRLSLHITTGAQWSSTTADLGACLGFCFAAA